MPNTRAHTHLESVVQTLLGRLGLRVHELQMSGFEERQVGADDRRQHQAVQKIVLKIHDPTRRRRTLRGGRLDSSICVSFSYKKKKNKERKKIKKKKKKKRKKNKKRKKEKKTKKKKKKEKKRKK